MLAIRGPTFFVDGEPIRGTGGPEITAAQILAAAGHDPDLVALYPEAHRSDRIPQDAIVPVQDGSRFVTARK